jgi:hypothetical protein
MNIQYATGSQNAQPTERSTMKKQPYRLYTSAEVYLDRTPDGSQKLAVLRFKTMEISPRGSTESATPWVMFPVEVLESLAGQLGTVAKTLRDWEPDQPAPDLGPHIMGSKVRT